MNSRADRAAWVDESESDATLDPGTYVLSAAIITVGAEPTIRQAMLDLQLPSKKLHWHSEADKRRRKISDTIAALDGLEHLVVVRANVTSDRPERRRRGCMEALLWELERHDEVRVATFEARSPTENKRDIMMVNALRGRHTISAGFRLEHTPGPAEPLLWVPDALCGAVVADRTGRPEYLQAYDTGKIRIIDV